MVSALTQSPLHLRTTNAAHNVPDWWTSPSVLNIHSLHPDLVVHHPPRGAANVITPAHAEHHSIPLVSGNLLNTQCPRYPTVLNSTSSDDGDGNAIVDLPHHQRQNLNLEDLRCANPCRKS